MSIHHRLNIAVIPALCIVAFLHICHPAISRCGVLQNNTFAADTSTAIRYNLKINQMKLSEGELRLLGEKPVSKRFTAILTGAYFMNYYYPTNLFYYINSNEPHPTFSNRWGMKFGAGLRFYPRMQDYFDVSYLYGNISLWKCMQEPAFLFCILNTFQQMLPAT